MNQSVIDIQGITKTYVNGKLTVPVLHGIDLPVSYTHLTLPTTSRV